MFGIPFPKMITVYLIVFVCSFRHRQSDKSIHPKVAGKRQPSIMYRNACSSLKSNRVWNVFVRGLSRTLSLSRDLSDIFDLHSLLRLRRLPLLLCHIYFPRFRLSVSDLFFLFYLFIFLSVLLGLARNYKLVFGLKCGKKHHSAHTHAFGSNIFFYNIHKIENLFFSYVMKKKKHIEFYRGQRQYGFQ